MQEYKVTILITRELVEERTAILQAFNRAEAESLAIQKMRKKLEDNKDFINVIKLSIVNYKDEKEGQHDKNASRKNVM
jgi:hypothetical protein|tara:strand:+ start:415 stop:648 length:234 start_codon:yes stop_codon:yes gene_type:complete